ncbi:unnamed protein product [Acanthoscelides obtectus]|uniref:Uncharacterized protein n=1 Tax=Acanthoscelides obtectus TaxID=200917 RepID=A0A9P0PTE8_ACAOB|nr:unnamed protein product [Acanthoscelides obtectus]CAK1667075.1 hypothetical protein AOBTE_LOCUS25664 [Acanthoscelides obtectus]
MVICVLWCLLVVTIQFSSGDIGLNCSISSQSFEKILGIRPTSNHSTLLFKSNSSDTPATPECISKCGSDHGCFSFLLDYKKAECYYFRQEVDENDTQNLLLDDNVAWFVKRCYENAEKCKKLWVMERVPGAILVDNDNKILPGNFTRYECQKNCLKENQCKSANFRVIDDTLKGTCALSRNDRYLLPSSYRVSGYDEEYFENQCSDGHVNNADFCSYEQYDNTTLGHFDIHFMTKTKEDCQQLCDQYPGFNCRAYTVKGQNCYLHSEDTKIFGPTLLKEMIGWTYYEKARCLNITVSCSETYMRIRYQPELNFHGKLYMQGFSENTVCYALGDSTKNEVILKLPILEKNCGITEADGSQNRTLMFGTLVLQYNPIIQTQNDRIIRVGCIFGNETKVIVGTGVKISATYPSKGSSLVAPTTNVTKFPVVQMKIIDLNKREEVSDTQIGQELQMIIELKANASYDIWASHLVAMTERSDESIFLLDDAGCPTNLNIFPALRKRVTRNSKQLVANFQAFKFASSPIVRFSVIVQFCEKECKPINCGDNVYSYGRRKREIRTHSIHTLNGTTVVKVNRTEFEGRTRNVNEMPLEYFMVVRDAVSTSDRLVFGDNKILFAGYNYSTQEVCLDYSLVVGLITTWIIVQIIFLVGCVLLVRRYKRYYQEESMRQSMEELHKNFGIGFSNVENRRGVHWADNDHMLG